MTINSYNYDGLDVGALKPIKGFGKYTPLTASAGGAAWFRVATIQPRIGMQVMIATTGGSYGPGFTKFVVFRSWDATTFQVVDIVKANSQYTTHARMSSSNGGGAFNLDIYFNPVTVAQLAGFAEVTVIPTFWGCTPDSSNTVYANPTRNPTLDANVTVVAL